MDNQALQQIKDIIDQNDQVSIAIGKNPHVDDMAAALSLYLTLQTAGKKVAIAAVTQPVVEHSSLVGVDKVTTAFETSGGDFIVSFPYQEEGEIEKVSYTLENNLLNIIVKPGEQGLSFSEKDVRYTHGGGVSGLVFTIGIPRLADISTLIPQENVKDLTIINIDNKEVNENYGNVVLVSPRFSSISEQVADLLLSLGYDFDVDTAQNLLNGLSAATNNFQSGNTSYLAFEVAAILLRKGAKRQTRPQPQPHQPQEQRHGGQQNRDGQPRQQSQFPQQRFDQRRPQNQSPRPQQQSHVSQQGNGQQSQVRAQVAPQPMPTPHDVPHPQIIESDQTQGDVNPPADWLTPKVYKGSTNV